MISGIQNLDGDTPIKGYGFGYAFDSIGNRTGSTVDGTTGSRQTSYVANQVNQYSSITSPGFEYLIGSAATNATVTANWTPEGNPPPALQPSDIVQAIRQGNRWYLELGVDNDPGPVWRTATIRGIVREGADAGAKDALQELQRPLFIPAATQSLGYYDADGNLTCDGRWNYSWDGNNRLETVESVAATPDARKRKVEYSYDYMGRMVRRIDRSGFDQGSYTDSSTIVIVYDGWNPILELDASATVLKRYYWGLDLSGSLTGAGGVGGLQWMADVGASKAYGYCYDGNGNVVGLVDLADGSLAANYEYGPFGEPITATGPASDLNPFRFSTKRTDPVTGLVYYGYRHYHPELGRWTSRDPIGERGGANLFVFCTNAPLTWTDDLGAFPLFWGDNRQPVRKRGNDGRTYTLTRVIVRQCEVVILYGEGHRELSHDFTFPSQCAAGEFVGCFPGTTNQLIPEENRLANPDLSMMEKHEGPFDDRDYSFPESFSRSMSLVRDRARNKADVICRDPSQCCKQVAIRFLRDITTRWSLKGGDYSSWKETRQCQQ